MKAQVKLEFIFSIVFFGLVLVFLVTQIANNNGIIITDSRADVLKAKTLAIIDLLSDSPGNPPDWENGGAIKRVGLASAPGKLSLTKINALKINCDLFEKSFGTFNYNMRISDETGDLLFCGYSNITISINIKRPFMVEGRRGEISLDLW